MRIAMIGAGHVGRALGRGWAQAGYEVVYGRREPASGTADERGVADAAAWGEAVVLAVPWSATAAVVEAIAPHAAGKVVVDATNPLGRTEGGLALDGGSGAEAIAARLPDAHVVKAFNQTGAETMADPAFPEGAATILVAGDDPDARATALALAHDLGFEAVDAGGLDAARHLEALALIWIHLALGRGLGRDIAFRLMRRRPSTR